MEITKRFNCDNIKSRVLLSLLDNYGELKGKLERI